MRSILFGVVAFILKMIMIHTFELNPETASFIAITFYAIITTFFIQMLHEDKDYMERLEAIKGLGADKTTVAISAFSLSFIVDCIILFIISNLWLINLIYAAILSIIFTKKMISMVYDERPLG